MTDSSLNLGAPIAPAVAAAPSVTAAPVAELVAPAPVVAVPAEQANEMVKLDAATVTRLDGMVEAYLSAITSLDVHGGEFATRVKDIQKLGDEDIKASAGVSNRLLEKPMAAMTKGGLAQASTVSRSLLELRNTVEDLDPGRQGDLLSPRKLLGLIPFGDRLRDYFDKYRSSQSHLDAIITALFSGQDELVRDNAAIEQEKANLWAVMGRLRQYVYLGQKLDAALEARIAEIAASDPERARVLREDMLFYVRQKVQDLLIQLAVSVQGYLALDVIRRNNIELIKGVDRATTTTVSALRTAVIVAQALSDQKLVLDQITALNTTTGNLIESTSRLLHDQSAKINEQAASATIDLAKLQAAFTNIYATMDEIDAFKLRALDNMAQTVTALSAEVTKSQAYLDRVRKSENNAALGGDRQVKL
jgi:uncharacterized protein YaaN involved in tellurite resistance